MRITNKEFEYLRCAVSFPKNYDWHDEQKEIEKYPYITSGLKFISMLFVFISLIPFIISILLTIMLSDQENFGDMIFGLLLFYAFTIGIGINCYSFLRNQVQMYICKRELFKFMKKYNLKFEFKLNTESKSRQKRYEKQMIAIQKGNNIIKSLSNSK